MSEGVFQAAIATLLAQFLKQDQAMKARLLKIDQEKGKDAMVEEAVRIITIRGATASAFLNALGAIVYGVHNSTSLDQVQTEIAKVAQAVAELSKTWKESEKPQ